MYIQTEITPNPATLKFLPGERVLEAGSFDFTNSEKANSSPLAKRIFEVDGVDGVFLGLDFITVTKLQEFDWEHLKPGVLGAIMDHFQSDEPVIHEDSSTVSHPSSTMTLKMGIENLLRHYIPEVTEVRPISEQPL